MACKTDRAVKTYRVGVIMSDESKQHSGVSRRKFLAAGWGVAIVALVGQAGLAMSNYLRPSKQPGGFGGEVIAGKPQEFKPGTVSLVQEGRFYISAWKMAAIWRCGSAARIWAVRFRGLRVKSNSIARAMAPCSTPQAKSSAGRRHARSISFPSSWSMAISSSTRANRLPARNSIHPRSSTSEAILCAHKKTTPVTSSLAWS